MFKYDVVLSGRNSHKFRTDFPSPADLEDTASCPIAHFHKTKILHRSKDLVSGTVRLLDCHVLSSYDYE